MPHLVVRFRQGSRLRAFNNQLGTVLMQLSGSMRAGYGLQQAVDFVAHELLPPAGIEFAQVVRDVKLGSALMEAMDDLAGGRQRRPDAHCDVSASARDRRQFVRDLTLSANDSRAPHQGRNRRSRLSSACPLALAVLPIIMFFILMLINPAYESPVRRLTLCVPIERW
jgi:tight adherence protein B